MKRALLIACAGPVMSAVAALRLAAAPTLPLPRVGPGDVTAVSVMPAPGKAELVIDVQGAVRISDFVLRGPSPRVVIDVVGAHLVAPIIQYDGVERAGIRNVRYSQFNTDVVRVVVDLTQSREYQIHQDSTGVHVAFAAGAPFALWSSDGARRERSAPLPLAIRPTPANLLTDTTVGSNAPAPASAPAPRPADAPALRQSGQPRISVTFDRASIQEVVANFAAFSGRSIVVGKDIAGTVTAEIKDQPWDVAFNAVLAGQGLAAIELPGGIIRVDSRQNLATQDSLEGLSSTIVRVNYARASSLAPSVAGMVSRRGKAVADTTTNSIIVTDVASRLDTLRDFISALDIRTPQVAIQAKIIHVQRTNIEALGLQYDLGQGNTQGFNSLIARPADTANAAFSTSGNSGTVLLGGTSVAAIANAGQGIASPALSLIYHTVLGNYALSTFLSALQSVQLSDVQAEPQVTVLDNRPANIWVGERTPYRQIDVSAVSVAGGTPARATTGFEETGIRLKVTPHIVRGAREVVLELHAENSTLALTGQPDTPFQVSTQTGETQLLVRDGETAVIAGLTSTKLTVSKSGIPFLVDLPLVGRLFGFTNTREDREDLIILVTPHIIDDLSGNDTNP
jgi:type IV pilus assembly protein PilQ